MFNVNGWEIVIIGVLFILLFGPEKLPEVAMQLGKTLRELRQMTEGATSELARELELAAKEMRETPDRRDPAPRDKPVPEGEKGGEAARPQSSILPPSGPQAPIARHTPTGPGETEETAAHPTSERDEDVPPPLPSIFGPGPDETPSDGRSDDEETVP